VFRRVLRRMAVCSRSPLNYTALSSTTLLQRVSLLVALAVHLRCGQVCRYAECNPCTTCVQSNARCCRSTGEPQTVNQDSAARTLWSCTLPRTPPCETPLLSLTGNPPNTLAVRIEQLPSRLPSVSSSISSSSYRLHRIVTVSSPAYRFHRIVPTVSSSPYRLLASCSVPPRPPPTIHLLYYLSFSGRPIHTFAS